MGRKVVPVAKVKNLKKEKLHTCEYQTSATHYIEQVMQLGSSALFRTLFSKQGKSLPVSIRPVIGIALCFLISTLYDFKYPIETNA